ncbi:hypothetical protein QUW14_08575, partial [Bacteroides gallinaceum]|uniref:hypothetical protein n=1 Tax=Bacteroides gallinaceum TaxID=1462571 RepID=UPI0025A35826
MNTFGWATPPLQVRSRKTQALISVINRSSPFPYETDETDCHVVAAQCVSLVSVVSINIKTRKKL